MVRVNSFLLNALGMQYLDTSLWAMNHASLSSTDEAVLMARKEEFLLYLTTNRQIDMVSYESLFITWFRMLLGVDIPNIQQIVMLRPPNMEHSVVQVNCYPQDWTLFHCSHMERGPKFVKMGTKRGPDFE